MVDMTRRQFLVALAATTVAAAAPSYVAPLRSRTELEVETQPERDLLGTYDGGQTHFKLRGNVVARDRGDTVEFVGWLKVPRKGLAGRVLAIQHPESGIWLPVS